MSDLASFDPEAILAIFGRGRCLFCGSYEIQGHHIVGRGKMKNSVDRKVHSSPFNYSPLCEKCHAYGPLHNNHIEAFFMDHASSRVFMAAAIGTYQLTEPDLQFQQRYLPPYLKQQEEVDS